MALSDLFDDQNEARARQAEVKGYRKARKLLRKGEKDFSKQYRRAADTIGDAAVSARGDVTGGETAALGYIDDYETPALDYYEPYAATGRAGNAAYADALGFEGDEGYARATDSFRTSPGYEFALDEGLTAVERRAASRGDLGSGNARIETTGFAQGLADQEWDDYLDRLFGQQQMGVGIAGEQAGIRERAGQTRAGIATDSALARAGITTDAATRRAAIRTGRGEGEYGFRTDLANLRLGEAGAVSGYRKGKDQSGANIIGAVTGGLSTGATLLGLGNGNRENRYDF